MNIGFIIKDVIQKIVVKFIPASLPTAIKPYNLKAVHQTDLDIHDIAMKAAVFNIPTSPKVIEEGLNAGFELMYYLAANGYRIKTPIFNLRICVPGQYDGTETYLPEGTFPVARLQTSAEFRKYLKEKVKVEFDGKDTCESFIADAKDEATGAVGTVMTRGNILTINGTGLKIEGDEEHKDLVGVFFVPKTGVPVKATIIALNNPRTLIVHIPNVLKKGESYKLAVGTQSSARNGARLLKKVRDIRSSFMLKAA